MQQIPLVDVKAQYAPLIPEIESRLRGVLESGVFILGPNVKAFEQEAAAFLGVRDAVGVANGTDALVLVLDALGVGPGDEVICPAFTFYATAEAIVRRGATPVFCDIDPLTLNLDLEDAAARVTKRTRALLPVHLFGRPAPLGDLAELGLPIVEDAAQAFGAQGVARVGAASTFSFFPTKNLFGLGDGGLVAATDAEVAERVRLLRFHGSRDKVDFELVGYNSRLDELQAAVLRLFLGELDGWNESRRKAASRYAELGLGEACEVPDRRSGARLPHVRRALQRARPHPGGPGRRRHCVGLLLRDAAAPSTGTLLPRLRRGVSAGDRAGGSREPRAADVGRDRSGRAGARGRDGEICGKGARLMFPVNRHRLWQLGADALLIALAWYAAWKIRFDFLDVPVFYEPYLSWETILLVVGIKLTIFVGFGFYNRWWRYVSTRDMWRAALGAVVASLCTYLLFYFVSIHEVRLPRSVAVLDVLLLLALVATSRMLARTVIERPGPGSLVAHGKEVLVVGAGDAGQLVIREMQKSRSYTPIGLIDDDPRKKNLRVHGIRVLGTSDELPHLLRDRRPDELLIAIPSASGDVRQRIVNAARDGGVPVKTLPGLYELIAGDHDLSAQIRPVQVEDVLGREPVEVDLAAISSYLAGETVLVTGAGGSIGSELCRQIARTGPQRMILVDLAETALYEIERELVDAAASPRACRCSPTSATARSCARCSSATGRASSSMRRRTSMCP